MLTPERSVSRRTAGQRRICGGRTRDVRTDETKLAFDRRQGDSRIRELRYRDLPPARPIWRGRQVRAPACQANPPSRTPTEHDARAHGDEDALLPSARLADVKHAGAEPLSISLPLRLLPARHARGAVGS